MTQAKKAKAPLFYPLTNKEWTDTVKDLTGAEIKVLYYIRSLDPFGDRNLQYGITQMAQELGLSKAAVSKAVKRLDQIGFINVELEKVSIRIRSSRNGAALFPRGNDVSYSEQRFLEETDVSYSEQQFPLGNRQEPEPLPNMASSPPHTIQTYSDFIQTLSDSERENFEKFVREEWKRLKGEEVISMERFLASEEDFKNWHEKFLNSPAGKEAKKKAIAAQFDWRNDPRFETWIWEAFNRGYEWVHENEAEREQRLAFYNWAFEVNAFEGVCL